MAVQKVVTYGHSALRAISKNITGKRKKEKPSTTEKNTIFLATSIIEGAHYTVTRSGREIDVVNFKSTYNRLKTLYEEVE